MLRISKDSNIDDGIYMRKQNSLQVLKTPRAGKIIAHWFLGLMLLGFIVMFLPWQQNIRANGSVTAFSPSDRPQTVQTAIAGRINEWKIREGQYVNKNDTILILSEIKEKFLDPDLVPRLEQQVASKSLSIGSKEAKVQALNQQIASLRDLLVLKTEQNQNKIDQKRLKVQSDSIGWEAAKIDAQIALRQLQGSQVMFDSGLIALIKLEKARSKKQQTDSKQMAALNKYNAAKKELDIALIELNTTKAEIVGKLSKAASDRDATSADVFDSQASLAKLRTTTTNMTMRSQQYFVLAPQDGYVVKALKSGLGETVKSGEAVVTIMPHKPAVAVELYVKAMDISLLDTGRHVRLQFDGWPALQFSGWPSVAVGTFGGKVSVIDYVDSKSGKYRILVVPDWTTEEGDAEWPEKLRQGSGVFGWVMLDEVPVWFEIWRQLNGFPPTVDGEPTDEIGKSDQPKDKKK